MISITKIFHFEAAHYLPYYVGKCAKLHGHSYKVEVTVSSQIGVVKTKTSDCGMIIDFGKLKDIVNPIIELYCDHAFLNNTISRDFYPTAENIAEWLAYEIQGKLTEEGMPEILVDKIVVWETKDSYATWTR